MQVCKSCGIEKEFRFLKIGKNGAFLYTDETGRLWKGKCCANCQASKRKQVRKQAKVTSNPENAT